MAEYAELVKKLRNRRVCLQTGLNLDNDYPLLREAADAVEQLSTELECLKSYMGEYKAAYIAEHDARMMDYKSDKEREADKNWQRVLERVGQKPKEETE